ncbi:MAG: response regulator, partial [Lentisphaeria bacterium]|nr:response regulator [Lentisphaeria bacterium]
MSDKIKVLAVDDAPANLMILKGCLRGGNFELVTCTNAIDALQEFKKQYFDILLLDVIMPGIDGFELRKLIREVDKERPIIFLTAMIDDGNMTMLNQITWDSNTYYLNKVFDKKVLVQKITEVVNMHRTRQLDRVYRDNLESELKLAGDLQRSLLPDWCILDDKVLVSSLYVPAMQVSGDIFELIRL